MLLFCHWVTVRCFFVHLLVGAVSGSTDTCSNAQAHEFMLLASGDEALLQVSAKRFGEEVGKFAHGVSRKRDPDGASNTEEPCQDCDFNDVVWNVRDLKFYMQGGNRTCEETADRDAADNVLNHQRIEPGEGPLQACRDWLSAVNDGDSELYIQHRLTCHHTLVASPQEADLCYPSCTDGLQFSTKAAGISSLGARPSFEGVQKRGWGLPCFEVPLLKRGEWSNCSNICLTIELFDDDLETLGGQDGVGNCVVEVPYVTGVSWPLEQQNNVLSAPWMQDFNRTTMLAFVGAEDRGSVGGQGDEWEGAVKRGEILQEMQSEASKINEDWTNHVFVAQVINGSDLQWDWSQVGPSERFWIDAWSLYASSNFSWQPHGDTATRRAFFDAVLFGSIPVIDTKALDAYRTLFLGKLWRGTRVEDVFVVIPEGKEKDGAFIINMVAAIPPEEIDMRRRRLKQLAPALQWSANTPGGVDAFLMALGVFRS